MTDITTIMRGDPSGAELVNFARQIADTLVGQNLTSSQIRNIFTEVRKIEAIWESRQIEALRRLNMLKPKLDYAVARASAVRELRDVLSKAIDEVNSASEAERAERFQRFMDLFEAILAYHRSKGGKK